MKIKCFPCLIVYVLLLIPLFGSSQQNVKEENVEPRQTVEKRMINRIDSIANIKLTEMAKDAKMIELEHKLSVAENLIEKENVLVSNLTTVITLLLGSFAFFSILFVFIGIRPAQKAAQDATLLVKDIEKDLDGKFEAFVIKQNKQAVQKALDLLNSEILVDREKAASVLALQSDHDFSEDEHYRMFKFIKKFPTSPQTFTLIHILTRKKNEYADQLYNEINSSDMLYGPLLRYEFGVSETPVDVATGLFKTHSISETLKAFLSEFVHTKPHIVYALLNRKKFVDGLTFEEKSQIYRMLASVMNTYKVLGNYEDTYFHKSYTEQVAVTEKSKEINQIRQKDLDKAIALAEKGRVEHSNFDVFVDLLDSLKKEKDDLK